MTDISSVPIVSAVSSDTLLTATIHFRQGLSHYDWSFAGNQERMMALFRRLAALAGGEGGASSRFTVVGGASPEGRSDLQEGLALRRARTAVELLRKEGLLGSVPPLVEALGVDWEGLDTLVSRSAMPQREELLHIIREVPLWVVNRQGVVVDGRKKQLMDLDGGEPWRWMLQHLFPELRCAYLRVQVPKSLYARAVAEVDRSLRVDSLPIASPPRRDTVRIAPSVLPLVRVVRDTVYIPLPPEGHWLALRTNLLYDAAAVPNVALEVPLGKDWTLTGTWAFAWWYSRAAHRYWRVDGGELELRRYLDPSRGKNRLSGHHVGLYGHLLSYDFSLSRDGDQSDLSYGGGVSYGYSVALSRRLSLDFTLGVGYFGGEYRKYTRMDDCDVRTGTYQRHWIGPTKAELGLVWLLGPGGGPQTKGKEGNR